MKKILLGIIAINLTFISFTTDAFEFKGIKSGMTQKEVEKIVSTTPRGLKDWVPNVRISGAIFHYTNEGKLWGINLYIVKYRDTLGRAANAGYENALKEFCNTYTEIIDGVNGKHSCLIKDEVLYRESVEWYKRELLQHLN